MSRRSRAPRRHLTQAQIVAYRDGELEDDPILDHVRVCSSCQARINAARSLERTLQSDDGEHSLRHPALMTLAAYFDQVLSPRPAARIARHLQWCDQCATQLEGLRQAMASDLPSPLPPARLIDSVLRQLPRNARSVRSSARRKTA